MMVMPRKPWILLRSSTRLRLVLSSMPWRGSSRMSIGGWVIRALARAVFLISPPLRVAALRCSLSPRLIRSMIPSTALSHLSSCSLLLRANSMFSLTVIPGEMVGDWGT